MPFPLRRGRCLITMQDFTYIYINVGPILRSSSAFPYQEGALKTMQDFTYIYINVGPILRSSSAFPYQEGGVSYNNAGFYLHLYKCRAYITELQCLSLSGGGVSYNNAGFYLHLYKCRAYITEL